MYERLIALEKMSGEVCLVRSKVWEVVANLKRMAFGTPMFSRRLDTGYLERSPHHALRTFVMSRHRVSLLSQGCMLCLLSQFQSSAGCKDRDDCFDVRAELTTLVTSHRAIKLIQSRTSALSPLQLEECMADIGPHELVEKARL